MIVWKAAFSLLGRTQVFEPTVDGWKESKAILVLSPNRSLGGLVTASKSDRGMELTMTLTPTVRVRVKLICRELNFRPDWGFGDARGIEADAKLADFCGKWVFPEFWGYWCGLCVARSLLELMSLHEDYADQRDKFVVFAVHNDSVESFAELDEKLKNIKARYWEEKDLPFSILIDRGATEKAYGIHAQPTGVLINPEGLVIGSAIAADLAAKLPPLSIGKLGIDDSDFVVSRM